MSAIVIDLSSGSMIEAAVVGSATPQVQVPSPALDAGTFTDEAQFKKDLEKTFEQWHVNPTNRNLLISEPTFMVKPKREQLAKLCFETLGASGLTCANDGTLSLWGADEGSPADMQGVSIMYREKQIQIVVCYYGYAQPIGDQVLPLDSSVSDIAERLIVNSIVRCEFSMQPTICQNICVFGDYFPDSDDYFSGLKQTIVDYAPSQLYRYVNVKKPKNHEHLVLQGGLKVAGHPSQQTWWFTKTEYETNGARFVHRKCL